MRLVEAMLRTVTLFGGLIGVVAILSLMLLTVVTVVFRAIGIAFPGTYVIAELLLIPAVSFSLAYAGYAGAHIRVELLIDRFTVRAKRLTEATVGALGTAFWMLVAWAGIREALRRTAQNETTPIINLPVAPLRWMFVAALCLFCVILLVQVVRALRGRPMTDPEEAELG